MISMFRYANALPFNSTSSDFYPQMVSSIAEAGPGVRGPTAKKLAELHLEAKVHDVDKHIVQFKVLRLVDSDDNPQWEFSSMQ
ncbi:hypothetical protein AMTR_s00003p00265570 [Amborella trichopoda]|uniref:Uncharacterized protein n=1 Tax=Amborella trichopoda TaxID=13333 RepID=W1P6Y9_AMBTC|nr:hypothetical protein AMTR_s00003p00265570 [Amborella trichopoda]